MPISSAELQRYRQEHAAILEAGLIKAEKIRQLLTQGVPVGVVAQLLNASRGHVQQVRAALAGRSRSRSGTRPRTERPQPGPARTAELTRHTIESEGFGPVSGFDLSTVRSWTPEQYRQAMSRFRGTTKAQQIRWLLLAGLTDRQAFTLAGTNTGNVGNIRRDLERRGILSDRPVRAARAASAPRRTATVAGESRPARSGDLTRQTIESEGFGVLSGFSLSTVRRWTPEQYRQAMSQFRGTTKAQQIRWLLLAGCSDRHTFSLAGTNMGNVGNIRRDLERRGLLTRLNEDERQQALGYASRQTRTRTTRTAVPAPAPPETVAPVIDIPDFSSELWANVPRFREAFIEGYRESVSAQGPSLADVLRLFGDSSVVRSTVVNRTQNGLLISISKQKITRIRRSSANREALIKELLEYGFSMNGMIIFGHLHNNPAGVGMITRIATENYQSVLEGQRRNSTNSRAAQRRRPAATAATPTPAAQPAVSDYTLWQGVPHSQSDFRTGYRLAAERLTNPPSLEKVLGLFGREIATTPESFTFQTANYTITVERDVLDRIRINNPDYENFEIRVMEMLGYGLSLDRLIRFAEGNSYDVSRIARVATTTYSALLARQAVKARNGARPAGNRNRTESTAVNRSLYLPQGQQFTPPAFNRKFGIEIECFGPPRSVMELALRNAGILANNEGYNHTTRAHWKLVTDSSLNNTFRNVEPFELVSPPLTGQAGLLELKKVCDVLAAHNCKVNTSCGLHVHNDNSAGTLKLIKNVLLSYDRYNNAIDSMMAASRRGNPFYAKSLSTYINGFEQKINNADTISEVKSIFNGDRYRKVNLQSLDRHGTIEFRQHQGTVEYDKMRNWILFLHNLLSFCERYQADPAHVSFDDFAQWNTPDIQRYYAQRRTQLT